MEKRLHRGRRKEKGQLEKEAEARSRGLKKIKRRNGKQEPGARSRNGLQLRNGGKDSESGVRF